METSKSCDLPVSLSKATYTKEEAKTILSAVEAFVKDLTKTF